MREPKLKVLVETEAEPESQTEIDEAIEIADEWMDIMFDDEEVA